MHRVIKIRSTKHCLTRIYMETCFNIDKTFLISMTFFKKKKKKVLRQSLKRVVFLLSSLIVLLRLVYPDFYSPPPRLPADIPYCPPSLLQLLERPSLILGSFISSTASQEAIFTATLMTKKETSWEMQLMAQVLLPRCYRRGTELHKSSAPAPVTLLLCHC